MIIDVLGLGESIHEYKDIGNLKIGVNDINRHIVCPHIVVINTISSFHPDRRRFIKGTSSMVHTLQKEKKNRNSRNTVETDIRRNCPNVTSYLMIKIPAFNKKQKPIIDIDNNFYHSRTSPFVAVMLAYKMGAEIINCYGVDLINHYAYSSGQRHDLEVSYWKALLNELSKKDVKVTFTKYSSLYTL